MTPANCWTRSTSSSFPARPERSSRASAVAAASRTERDDRGTLRALWRERHRIDPAFRRDPANRALFMQILRSPVRVIRELRRMNQHDILGRYLPAFGRVVGQMQHDLYHVYTVDEHILKVVRNVRRFAVPELAHEFPLCSRLMSDFARPELLYLAGLFHDIARARRRSLKLARRRAGLLRAHGLNV